MPLEKSVSRIFSFAILLLTLSLTLTHANGQTLSLTCTLPATARVGVAYTGASCTPSGGSPSYTYAISVGTLPGGLSISSATGAITGRPTTAGSTYSFTVKVTDGEATPKTATFPVTNFVVAPAVLTLGCTLPTTAQVGVAYTGASCTPSGGSPSYTYSISAGTLPGGLSISPTTGAITGTPITAGSSYSFTVKVTDGEATPQTATFPVTNFVVAPAALTLTCTLPGTAQVGVAYTGASCTPGGGSPSYAYSISAGTLPGGLSISTTTGAITGTPTTAGSSYSFTVKVTDGESTPQTATFPVTNFVVAPAALTLTCTLPPTAQVGVAYTGASCTPGGGSPSYTYAISAGTLPGGLSISPTTGAITGTPTTAGSSYSFTVKVTDGEATPQTATFPVTNFVVSPAGLTLTCTLPATAQVGVAYTGATCTPSGGSPSYTYAISAGTLPGGLSISPTTGAITGTPTTPGSSYSFTIKVTDGEATPQTATFPVANFVVAPAGLTLTCTLPATAQVGVAYSGASCTPSGGSPSYTYAISAGTLPGGLSINSTTGTITGTPTTAGTTYSFTIKVTDGESTPQTATFPVTNFVVTPASLTLTCTLPATAQVGVAYTGATCAPGGGSPPYTYSISAGTLPTGLNIDSASGAITGTPTTAGSSYSFTIKVTDGEATPQTTTFPVSNFVVSPPTLTLTCNLPGTAQVSVAYSGSCSAGGGTPGYTYSISAGSLPPGLSLNSSSGAVTGTPTTAGSSYSFTVKAVDSSATPQAATQVFSGFVVAAPTLTLSCTFPATAEVGLNYTGASCTPTGGTPSYTFAISSGNLPAGLSISSSTGAITGTPTTAGTFSFTVKVSDSGSQSATQVVNNFSVLAALTLTCTAPSSAVVESSYLANCNAAGGTSPYVYAKGSGNLPNGLSLNSANGAITGTLSTAGTFTFTVNVTDSGNPAQTASSQSITVTAIPVLSITTTALANAIVGVSYSASCSATGGTAPYAFVTSAGSLPGGLSLNPTTCAITGTPTASGPFNFAIKVTDSSTLTQQTATQPLSITVNPALSVSTTSVPNGSVGLYYATTLGTLNGTAPFAWSVLSGTVPPGLNATSSGLINGTPTTVGTYTFTMKVTDSGSPAQSATQTFTGVTIAAGLTITTTQLTNGIVGAAYNASLNAQNGVPPYTWSLGSNSLPAGLSISGSSVTGTPTAAGTSYFTVKVTDNSTPTAQVATQALSVTIAPVLSLSSNTLANGTVGVLYSSSCSASGGTAPLTYSVVGALPAGLSLNASTCTVSGTPSGPASTSSFSIKVTDSSTPTVQSATANFSIAISAGLTITTTTVPAGAVSQAYTVALAAQNGTSPYSWVVSSGALPPGLYIGGSNITGTPTTKGTYSFTVKVTDNSGQTASQALSLVINPATLTLSCYFPGGAQVGVAYPSGGCGATGGTMPYTFSIAASTPLPGGFTLNTFTGSITGTPTTPGTFSFNVNISDAGSPAQTATQTQTITVAPASAPQVPTFTFAGLPSTQSPGIAITSDSLSLSTSSAAWPVTISLSFTPNAAGVSSTYIDPALQFVDGTGKGLGPSYNVTVPALTNSLTLPQITPGTVAGKVNLTLSVTGQTGATSSFTVPQSVPFIAAGSVQVLNVTSTGFTVEVIANSSPRDLKSATFSFNAAGNAVINGTTSFTVDVSSLMTGWYAGATSQQYGSLFMLTVPFTFSGNVSAISTVSVTLTNSVGTSVAATGTI